MSSDTTGFIQEARTKCALSIRNTAVGDWLGDALRRLEQLEAENERLRQALESALSWLEAAAMGCDQGGSQYGDAAERARQALTKGDDHE